MLRDIATVIVASGGLNKAAIIAAILRAKLCHVLVCDEATLRAAMGLLRGAG
jgi:DNA-binding transcriptional regulator LsrR (DeoR family)